LFTIQIGHPRRTPRDCHASEFAIPEVSQDRFAVRTPAGSGEGPPTMHTAYVRAGPVLLVVHTGADDSTGLDDAAITTMITKAVDKLP
jgi:hypothetical protein